MDVVETRARLKLGVAVLEGVREEDREAVTVGVELDESVPDCVVLSVAPLEGDALGFSAIPAVDDLDDVPVVDVVRVNVGVIV